MESIGVVYVPAYQFGNSTSSIMNPMVHKVLVRLLRMQKISDFALDVYSDLPTIFQVWGLWTDIADTTWQHGHHNGRDIAWGNVGPCPVVHACSSMSVSRLGPPESCRELEFEVATYITSLESTKILEASIQCSLLYSLDLRHDGFRYV